MASFRSFALIAFVFVLTAALPSAFAIAQSSTSESAEIQLSAEDEAFVAKMSLRKKVGQLFMFGFMGGEMERGLGKTLSKLSPGAIIVFGRNIKSARQIADLNLAAQKASIEASGLPLLIAVDQEGGDVIRIKTSMPLPSALAIGASGQPALAQKAGGATGRLLKTLGFNMNLAPVLDVGDPSQNLFIGNRTFGNDPQTVGQMGVGFSNGLMSEGVLPTGKHFPGHGRVKDDSHKETTRKMASLSELQSIDLVPFRAMQERFGNNWAVVLAHVAYPALDPSEVPATFSKPIVDGLLRKQIGFNGLVITDDIEMAGAFAIKDPKERAIRAVEAGVDMIMVAWNKRLQSDLVDALEKAVKSGRISEARINQSVRRIVAAKRAHAKGHNSRPTSKELKLALRNPHFREVAHATVLARLRDLAEKGDREFRDFAHNRPILVFSANKRFTNSFQKSKGSKNARYFGLSVERPYDVDRVMRANPKAIGVFYVSGQTAARVLNRVSNDIKSRLLVVTVEPQGSLYEADSYRLIAEVYFRHPQLGKLVADYYFSRKPITPRIRMPASEKEGAKIGYRDRDR